MSQARWRFVLGGILLLAAVLRLSGLEVQSLWMNELDSWWISQHEDLALILGRGIFHDPHPQGFQLILWLWIKALGDGEAQLRTLPVLAGLATVALMAGLGRRLYDPLTGLVAASFTAVSWMPLYYAQEARAYALLMALAVAGSWMLWNLLERREAGRSAPWPLVLGFVLTAAALCYVHYFGILVVGFFGAAVLLRLGITLWTAGLFLAIGLLYLPWLPSLLADLGVEKHWIPPLTWRTLPNWYLATFNQSALLALLIALPLQAWATWSAWRDRPSGTDWRRDPTLFLVLWIVLPLGVVTLKSLVSLPVISTRNLIICLPPLLLLAARGVTCLPLATRGRALVGGIVSLVLLTHLLFGLDYYTRPVKEDFRGIVAAVLEHPTHAEAPVAGSNRPYYYDYYLRAGSAGQHVAVVATNGSHASRLDALAGTAPGRTIWLLNGRFFRPDEALLAHLDAHYELLEVHERHRARAALYRLRD